MKIGPNANFPVYVQPESWQRDGDDAPLFEGIVRATLNHMVTVLFVPDVAAVAPPWDFGAYPGPGESIGSPLQARLFSVLTGPYSVTPNDTLAGTAERIAAPAGHPLAEWPTVVFYVGQDEFARYIDELDRIADEQEGPAAVAELAQYQVAALLERVAASGLLEPEHAKLLGGPRRPG